MSDDDTRTGPDGTGDDGPRNTRYLFGSRIATGGMGEVWNANDRVLGRPVAIKVLKSEYADDPTFRERFQTEARNAAALHHPNVASVFDYGELPGGSGGSPRPFLVMELVRGEPLSVLLRADEPMPPDTAANLLAQAADGLAAAHELGIVHRDVKPANLLITPDRTVKITDFGIARAADATALTRTGQVIGTPQYLSPEQAEGKPATAASDVYSLGVVLYECLAGRRPFEAESPIATALAHLREPPPPLPSDVPSWLREAATVALAKDPARRFASMRDFASALRGGPVRPAGTPDGDDGATRVLGAPVPPVERPRVERTVTRRSGPPPVPPEERDRRRSGAAWLPWLAAAVAVLIVVGLVAWLASRNGSSGSGGGSEPSTTTSTSSTPTPSPTRTQSSATESATPQVTVNRGDYVGRPFEDARSDLEDKGLKVSEHRVDNPGDKQANTVADVDPTGTVEKGSIITLSVYGEPVPTPTPTPTPTSSSSAPVTPSASTTPPGQTGSGKPSKSPKAAGKEQHGKGGGKH